MDSFEFNKVFMAILGTVFIVMSLSFISDSLFHNKVPEQQGYAVEVAEASTGGEAEEDTGPAFEPISAMLASADIAEGEKIFKKCSSCHTNVDGGANKVGPALWGIVERPIASADGFSYSGALKTYAEGKTWSYEELNGFLWKPKTYVKGTSMGFGGIKKVEDRAALVAYLRSLAGTPAPLPQ
ncbi:MAG: cytochrome c family protein [Rhizobiaceae bacterium]|nr:cytochrome c family protein [Rhizobiaceae bacterium]